MEIYKILSTLDRACDYIPVISTVSNSVDLFEKLAFKKPEEEISSREFENKYIKHIRDKSAVRCVILLIPVLGNAVVALWDLTKQRKDEGAQDPSEKLPDEVRKTEHLNRSDAEEAQDPSEIFPDEVMVEIFKHCGAYDLDRCKLVSKNWKGLADDRLLWIQLGLKIGLSKNDLKENPEARVKQEIKVKLKGFKSLQNSNAPHNTPPESIQNLLNDPASPENLAKLESWLQARSTVIVYEKLKQQNSNLTDLKASLYEGDQWERIFKSYAEWSEENQNELQNITNLNLCKMRLLKLPEGIFNGLNGLTRLYLSSNQLSELPEGVFNGLKNLGWLYICNNKLQKLPNLGELQSLQSLTLNDNKLQKLPNLDELESLHSLYLRNNKISEDRTALQKVPARIKVFT